MFYGSRVLLYQEKRTGGGKRSHRPGVRERIYQEVSTYDSEFGISRVVPRLLILDAARYASGNLPCSRDQSMHVETAVHHMTACF
jgi:hypothetical protein